MLKAVLEYLAGVLWMSRVPLVFMAGGAVLGAILVRYTIEAAHRHEILARPSERGSHSVPTPRLGGLGVAGVVYLVLAVIRFARPNHLSGWETAVFVGGAFALIGGLMDDILELNARWKFLFQFAAAGSAVILGATPGWDRLIANPWLGAALDQGGAFLFIIFLMNAYNFMDGMDGQAALFGALASLGMMVPLCMEYPGFAPAEAVVLGALAGALIGLASFNLPGQPQHRKTFMGDCGSQFVGFTLAVFVLRQPRLGLKTFSVVSALILLSPFIWDVCYTLVRRLARRENIFKAHRSHLYQRLLVAGWTHSRALALNGALWTCCAILSLLYEAASRNPGRGEAALVVLVTLALLSTYTLAVLWVERRACVRAASQSG